MYPDKNFAPDYVNAKFSTYRSTRRIRHSARWRTALCRRSPGRPITIAAALEIPAWASSSEASSAWNRASSNFRIRGRADQHPFLDNCRQNHSLFFSSAVGEVPLLFSTDSPLFVSSSRGDRRHHQISFPSRRCNPHGNPELKGRKSRNF